MTTEQQIEWGMEIIAGMKASAYGCSLEEGRLMVADDMNIPTIKQAVEEQAVFIAEVAIKKLSNIDGIFDFIKSN